MANSVAVKKLGNRWKEIRERCRKVSIPRQGMTLKAFAKANLADVPPNDVTAILRALRRGGDILVLLVEGERRVYREKPKGKIRRAVSAKDPALAVAMASIMADVLAYADGGNNRTLDRIGRKLRLAVCKGVSPSAIWTALKAVYAPALGEALDMHGLDLAPPCEPGADIEGHGPEALVLRYVARRGAIGAGRADMLKGIRPYLGAKAIASALASLEDQYLIVSCECIPGNIGRKRDVYFLAEHGLPRLEANGSYSIVH